MVCVSEVSEVVVGRKQWRVHVHFVAHAISSEAVDVVNDESFVSVVQLRYEFEFVADVTTSDAAALQAVSAADHLHTYTRLSHLNEMNNTLSRHQGRSQEFVLGVGGYKFWPVSAISQWQLTMLSFEN